MGSSPAGRAAHDARGVETMSGGVVLLADDDPLVRRATGRLLQVLGHEVHDVEDGLEAEAVLARTPGVTLVLLDLMMPGRSADETVAALRRLRPDVPIVLCSGYAADDVAARLLTLPGLFQLQKPFNRAQMVELLTQINRPVPIV
ncbi:MAG: response regulator [Myxococcaceae bacterium]|nr:response regulator [Myxococcaceae bacterium]